MNPAPAEMVPFLKKKRGISSGAGIGSILGGLAGGIIGGAAFGALGQHLALGVSAQLGTAAFTFAGGALHGAIEFGLAGFGAGFGGALGAGASFKEALKAGGAGAAVGAGYGAAIQGSYMAGWQNVAHGSSRIDVYERGIQRLHALSVNASDKTTAIVGSRPIEAIPGARHRYIRGRVGRFEMGPDAATQLIEINGENSLAGTEWYLKNLRSQVLETTVVARSHFINS